MPSLLYFHLGDAGLGAVFWDCAGMFGDYAVEEIIMKKIGFVLLGVVIALVAGAFVGGKVIGGYITPDYLVKQIESSMGCRAEIDSVKVSLLGSANIKIKGLSLAKRDKFVEDGTALSDRLPLEKRDILVKSVFLKVQPMDLIKHRLYVQRLTLDGMDIRLLVRRDGTTNINDLFSQVGGEEAKPGNAAADEESDGGVEMPMAIKADRVEVINSQVTADIEASGSRVMLKNAGFGFSDIDLDPGNFASHNKAKFQFTGDISIGGKGEKQIFEAKLSGAGDIEPFDPVLGKWEPKWKSTITLAKGSKLDTVPLMGKMREALSKVSQLGIDLNGLLINGELKQDATTEISHQRGKYQFEQPLLLDFTDTTLDLHAGSWINAAENKHEMTAALTASQQFSTEVQAKAAKYVSEKTSGMISGDVVKSLFAPIMKDGQIKLEVVSSGDLGNPKADIITPVGKITNIGSLLKGSGEAGGDLLKIGKGLLDGIFGKKK